MIITALIAQRSLPLGRFIPNFGTLDIPTSASGQGVNKMSGHFVRSFCLCLLMTGFLSISHLFNTLLFDLLFLLGSHAACGRRCSRGPDNARGICFQLNLAPTQHVLL